MNKKIEKYFQQLQGDLLEIQEYSKLIEHGEASPEDIQRSATWALNSLYKITEELTWEEANKGNLVTY